VLIVLTNATLSSLSSLGLGWSFSSYYIGSEPLRSSSGINVASAGGSHNGITPCTATNSGLLQGGPGNDQIFGNSGEDDFLVGGRGSDHMFGDIGNDVLAGGPGADYFDCGDGYDMIMDIKLEQGDVTAGNCEVF